jgi:hypothetical protein
MEHGYSGLDEHSKVRHLLTGIRDNAVQPVVCQVLAMREDKKTFTACSALFADFICHLKQNPSNVCRVTKLSSSGRGGGRGRDAGGRGGGGRGRGNRGGHGGSSKGTPIKQSEVDKVTWLQANKYYTPKECTQGSLHPKRLGFISTAQSPQLPSAKLLLWCMVMTKLAGSQTMKGTSLVTMTTRAFCPSTPLGQTQPILRFSARRRKPCVASDRHPTQYLTMT